MPGGQRFAKGFNPDTADYCYPHHSKLAAELPALPAPDHSAVRSGFLWQSNIGMCVGEALARAVQLWCALNGHGDQVLISALLAYVLGRSEEYAGFDPENLPPLIDGGSEPGLVLQAMREVGMLLARDYPGPESPAFDRSLVNRRPTPAALVKAYDARGLEFYDIPLGTGFRDGVRAAMVRRYPVIFSTFVDAAFEDNRGEVIKAINEQDPSGGGHMLAMLNADNDEYFDFDNWWDNPAEDYTWGKQTSGPMRGTSRMTWACFEAHAVQVLAVRGFPMIPQVTA